MSTLYSKTEKKGSADAPVIREVVIGDAADDATPWVSLGAVEPTIEVRSVTVSGTRTEVDTAAGTSRTVAHYLRDQDAVAWTSSVVIETKQSYEDDDQAGTIATITGGDYVQNMQASEVGDYVRLRIDSIGAGENILMAVAVRGQ